MPPLRHFTESCSLIGGRPVNPAPERRLGYVSVAAHLYCVAGEAAPEPRHLPRPAAERHRTQAARWPAGRGLGTRVSAGPAAQAGAKTGPDEGTPWSGTVHWWNSTGWHALSVRLAAGRLGACRPTRRKTLTAPDRTNLPAVPQVGPLAYYATGSGPAATKRLARESTRGANPPRVRAPSRRRSSCRANTTSSTVSNSPLRRYA